jgi:hypothetical protein
MYIIGFCSPNINMKFMSLSFFMKKPLQLRAGMAAHEKSPSQWKVETTSKYRPVRAKLAFNHQNTAVRR